MKLLGTIHDLLERHLALIGEEDVRQDALRYLRGLKSLLAIPVDMTSRNAIPLEDHVSLRVERAVAVTRSRQIADARRVHQSAVGVFGWDNYDDIN
ncbi:hypothetical protein [Rhizobium leguminosarum]|uniref:hypothetical protein n=1 Tax=Rhizobium leguminosarum TaxID=384 RepID=UPI0014424B78|nr:hypothetical protein [Rhizobium leguminosarum]MBY5755889.1 hypothetical protein [Rhizobium leguminosarum]MBY5775191.1 hypothetical protein [Rhizobium leguminosarum]MBY5780825.1 hypothetical protein [Rhizobium leguminosarum]MBY5796295.1 hypothetical protein [Rhizobium leguminosarum]MBY5827352.1 hypothetical protein [Rhizobium leguminosarum]